MAKMLLSALLSLFRAPYQLEPVIRQLHFIGARSMLVIVISGLFTGMVLALQFHNTLERFGSVDLLGSAVALALLRELGPVMAALMVVGRAGSAMCAEIGIMRTSEQIRCAGVHGDRSPQVHYCPEAGRRYHLAAVAHQRLRCDGVDRRLAGGGADLRPQSGGLLSTVCTAAWSGMMWPWGSTSPCCLVW